METKTVRPNILALANHMGGKKPGAKDAYDYEAPEYLILEPACVTDEMAQAIMTFARREKVTASEVAQRLGKSVEETKEILLQAADVGILIVNSKYNNKNGEDVFWYEPWVPGVMEMMANHKENVKKYPQIAYAFEAYGRIRGSASAGMFPVGVGLMRVIPIESAIDGNSKTVSYEEISKYLNDSTMFSVSDCSCRTSREAMGEGCGHLKEDMCIQLDHAAEYYIRTGRGREITREEAFAIIKRAEENGLMHQIPNIDGEGHTHAICNCCGCGCFALRSGTMFQNVDMVRSNYVASVEKEKCVACGECVKNCPMNALRLGQKVCSQKPVVEKIEWDETPRDTDWSDAEKWNMEYRTNRKNVVETGTAPCKTKCPAHISVQGYIRLASQGKYKEALELIKRDNPFPAVCGRVCPHGCESECTRTCIDEPIAIDEIKKFIADQELKEENQTLPKKRHDYSDKKIAVIGAGPAGLSCAYYLALDGYDITVFEKETVSGGMLYMGIPSFRLEKDVLNAEIDVLKKLGVKFKTGVEVGKDVTLAQLRQEGFKGFFVAIGASKGRKINLPGADCENVLSGIEFLRKVALKEAVALGKNTLVIGGGNVAIDVSRTAVRVGAENVKMVCLESRTEMPALPEEIEEAAEENVEIINGYGIKELKVADGKVCAVVFQKCTAVFDAQGKFAPVYDEADTMELACDHLLLSVGQAIDFGAMLQGENVALNANGTVQADALTLQSSVADIFVGGDVYTGPQFAIHAIASGKQGAISLHRFVQNGQSLVYGRDRAEYISLDKNSVVLDGFDKAARQNVGHSAYVKNSFADNRKTFTEEQMKKETARCLGCGATIVDEFMCVGCGQCTVSCKFDAITLKKEYAQPGLVFEKMKPAVVKNVLKRKVRIIGKKIKKTAKKKLGE